MSRMSNEEYIEKGGLFCPECREQAVESLPPVSDVWITVDNSCSSCGFEWTDDYKLFSYYVRENL